MMCCPRVGRVVEPGLPADQLLHMSEAIHADDRSTDPRPPPRHGASAGEICFVLQEEF